MSPKEQVQLLKRGMVDFVSEAELVSRIEKKGRLVVKVGFDPTRPDLHLGHSVLIQKMKLFQDFGHDVVFVVGDFTARIGDPSGKNKTRPPLTPEEISLGAASYAEQAYMILDKSKTRLAYNNEWLGSMGFDQVIRLASKYTLAQMIERDDFKKRYLEHSPIALHEMLYPLAQGYDSVHLKADVELGGSDQLFNLLVGRDLMREFGLQPQIVMTVPILEGLNAREEDGKIVGDKMSKSLDNYVGIGEAPFVQYSKLMSISDAVMWRYYELLSFEPLDVIAARKKECVQGTLNPKVAKEKLAIEIVSRFWSESEAKEAQEKWTAQFSRREIPTDMPEFSFPGELLLVKALVQAKVFPSLSEARRKIAAGAVDVDEVRISDANTMLTPRADSYTIRAGKRQWVKVKLL